MKHTEYDLGQMKGLPLSSKVRMTKLRLESFVDACWGDIVFMCEDDDRRVVLRDIAKSLNIDLPAGNSANRNYNGIIFDAEIFNNDSSYKDWLEHGCNQYRQDSTNLSFPLAFWTDNDVLGYLVQNGLAGENRVIFAKNECGDYLSHDQAIKLLEDPFEYVEFVDKGVRYDDKE